MLLFHLQGISEGSILSAFFARLRFRSIGDHENMVSGREGLSYNRPVKRNTVFFEKLVAHVNRKEWWHVPPRDPSAYSKRGKFLASSFREAEFWGRPLDEPQRVTVAHPLVGDEEAIERKLFGRRVSSETISVKERWALDAKMKVAAQAEGYDSIALITPKAFSAFKKSGKLPRSIELNILVGSRPSTH